MQLQSREEQVDLWDFQQSFENSLCGTLWKIAKSKYKPGQQLTPSNRVFAKCTRGSFRKGNSRFAMWNTVLSLSIMNTSFFPLINIMYLQEERRGTLFSCNHSVNNNYMLSVVFESLLKTIKQMNSEFIGENDFSVLEDKAWSCCTFIILYSVNRAGDPSLRDRPTQDSIEYSLNCGTAEP